MEECIIYVTGRLSTIDDLVVILIYKHCWSVCVKGKIDMAPYVYVLWTRCQST